MTLIPSLLASALALAASPPSIDEPLKTGEKADNDAAVVIGIEDYLRISKVPYARRDAAVFRDFLLHTRGVPEHKIQLLNEANREIILKAVDDAVAQVGDGGTLWVYYAGHGAASVADGKRMLLGDDVRSEPELFDSRGVKVAEIEAKGTDKGVQTMLVLDTCYTGVGRSGDSFTGGKRFVVPTYAKKTVPTVNEWAAASADQMSGPYQEAEHGLFTYWVVGALRGWADGANGDPDGKVTVEEARTYVANSLQAIGQRSQTPAWVGDLAGDTVLSIAKEKGPDLVGLTGKVADSELSGMDKIAQLQELAKDRDKEVSALRAEATREWAKVWSFAAPKRSPETWAAVTGFNDKYGSAEVMGEKIPIDEVKLSEAWIAAFPSEAWAKYEVGRFKKLDKNGEVKGAVNVSGERSSGGGNKVNLPFGMGVEVGYGPRVPTGSPSHDVRGGALQSGLSLGIDRVPLTFMGSIDYSTQRVGSELQGWFDVYLDPIRIRVPRAFGIGFYGGYHPAGTNSNAAIRGAATLNLYLGLIPFIGESIDFQYERDLETGAQTFIIRPTLSRWLF